MSPKSQATGPNPPGDRMIRWSVLAAILLVTGFLSWHSLGGLDIWLHDQVGSEILAGRFPSGENTYSYVEPHHPWTNHEWFFQVVVAALGPAGENGLPSAVLRWNLLRTLLSLGLVGALLHSGHARRKCPLLGPIFLLGLALLWPRLLLRPELVSYLIFALLITTLDRPADQWSAPGRLLSVLDPRWPLGRAFWLILLWAQLHGFAILGPLVLVLAALLPIVPLAAGASVWPDRRWLVGLGLSILALVLTPNGLQGLLYPLKALGQFQKAEADLQGTISELVPLLESPGSLNLAIKLYLISLVWGLGWIVFSWGRTSLLRIVIWAAAAVAAYLAQRNLGFYAVAFLLLHTETGGFPLARRLLKGKSPGPASLGPIAGLLVTLVLGGWWIWTIVSGTFYLSEGVSRRFGGGTTPARYPLVAARLVADQDNPRVFTNVDGAAFLLNRGQARVFIDGRTEAYSAEHWARYQRLKAGDQAALADLQNQAVTSVFLHTPGGVVDRLARSLLGHPAWVLTHWEESGLLFEPVANRPSPAPPLELLARSLPSPGNRTAGLRAADRCLAWAKIAELGGLEQARETALRRGLEFRSDHPALNHNLGNVLMARQKWTLALEHFEKALQVNGRLAASALNAGVCLLRLDRTEAAVARFKLAAELDRQNYQAWTNLGLAHLMAGQNAQAQEALRVAARLRPEDSRIRQLLRQAGSP